MRIHGSRLSIALCAGLMLGTTGCDDGTGRPGFGGLSEGPIRTQDDPAGTADAPEAEPAEDEDEGPGTPAVNEPLTTDQVRAYLSRIAPVVAGRSLRYDEFESEADSISPDKNDDDAVSPRIASTASKASTRASSSTSAPSIRIRSL